MPSLLTPKALYSFLGIWVPTWGFAMFFLRKLSELSTLKELKVRPNYRLNLVLPEIRGRVWWLGFVGFLSSLALWFLASTNVISQSPMYGLAAGFLVGIELSYLIILPFWFGEVHRFIERIKLGENVALRTESFLKEFSASNTKK